jgi:hypothetical protein
MALNLGGGLVLQLAGYNNLLMALNLGGGLVLQLAGYNNLLMALNLGGGLVLQLAGYSYNLTMALKLCCKPCTMFPKSIYWQRQTRA